MPWGMFSAVSIDTMAVVGELARKAPPRMGRSALPTSSWMIAGRMTRNLAARSVWVSTDGATESHKMGSRMARRITASRA